MKNIIIFSIIILTAIAPSLNLNGQDDVKKKELGLQIYGPRNYGPILKFERKNQKYLRFRLFALSFGSNRNGSSGIATNSLLGEISNKRGSIGFAIGVEKRKPITDKLTFVHGWEPGFYLTFRNDDYRNQPSRTYMYSQLRLGYILGFQYNVSKKVYLSLEAIPYLYSFLRIENFYNVASMTEIEGESYGVAISANLQSTHLSFVYRF